MPYKPLREGDEIIAKYQKLADEAEAKMVYHAKLADRYAIIGMVLGALGMALSIFALIIYFTY